MDEQTLRASIKASLEDQGFRIQGQNIFPPQDLDKEKLRDLHSLAVQHRLERPKTGLARFETSFLKRLACGAEIVPEEIVPQLVEVQLDSDEERLFRYASLHWSIPVSSGYGRRLRFLVVDQQNGKLIGLFGLSDPIFNLGSRDKWIGWSKETQRNSLHLFLADRMVKSLGSGVSVIEQTVAQHVADRGADIELTMLCLQNYRTEGGRGGV